MDDVSGHEMWSAGNVFLDVVIQAWWTGGFLASGLMETSIGDVLISNKLYACNDNTCFIFLIKFCTYSNVA